MAGAAATATVGATVLTYLDDIGNDIKQSYEAAQRAGRVGVALVVCINEYGNPNLACSLPAKSMGQY